jgi:hypothetical protein
MNLLKKQKEKLLDNRTKADRMLLSIIDGGKNLQEAKEIVY